MYDVTIIGTGIVGLATGLQLLKQNPKLKIACIDKETTVSRHQSGNNSGVIHSGIYYTPGGSKAKNCKKGYAMLLDFVREHELPHELCGKVIVATKESERPLLENIFQRGLKNGLKGIRRITAEETLKTEPHVRVVEAIRVPEAGIIDYRQVAEKYAELIAINDGQFFLGHTVMAIDVREDAATVITDSSEISSRLVINCAGLYADKIARLSMPEVDILMLPFRGEYYKLAKEKEYLVNGLIYPVPDPNFPFLGVHFTKMIRGGIEAGPNAVLAFQREGYRRNQVNIPELWETLSYPGFRKIAAKYWKTGLGEMHRSFSKSAFVKALQHLMPTITSGDLVAGGAGVRAQACAPDGTLVDDFLIYEKKRVINVCNAPSPAATASLSIGEQIAERALKNLG